MRRLGVTVWSSMHAITPRCFTLKASKMKMIEMSTEKLSSVKRVMYDTNADRSNATISISMTNIHTPTQNRKPKKGSSKSLKKEM